MARHLLHKQRNSQGEQRATSSCTECPMFLPWLRSWIYIERMGGIDECILGCLRLRTWGNRDSTRRLLLQFSRCHRTYLHVNRLLVAWSTAEACTTTTAEAAIAMRQGLKSSCWEWWLPAGGYGRVLRRSRGNPLTPGPSPARGEGGREKPGRLKL